MSLENRNPPGEIIFVREKEHLGAFSKVEGDLFHNKIVTPGRKRSPGRLSLTVHTHTQKKTNNNANFAGINAVDFCDRRVGLPYILTKNEHPRVHSKSSWCICLFFFTGGGSVLKRFYGSWYRLESLACDYPSNVSRVAFWPQARPTLYQKGV